MCVREAMPGGTLCTNLVKCHARKICTKIGAVSSSLFFPPLFLLTQLVFGLTLQKIDHRWNRKNPHHPFINPSMAVAEKGRIPQNAFIRTKKTNLAACVLMLS